MVTRLIVLSSALLISGLLLVPTTHADSLWFDDTRAVDLRQQHQEWTIRQGMSSGLIDAHEARMLQREQSRIRDLEARMRSDGVVTWHERVSLNRELNQAALHIYRERADGWNDRWRAPGWNDGRYDGRNDRRQDRPDRRNDKPSRSWIH